MSELTDAGNNFLVKDLMDPDLVLLFNAGESLGTQYELAFAGIATSIQCMRHLLSLHAKVDAIMKSMNVAEPAATQTPQVAQPTAVKIAPATG